MRYTYEQPDYLDKSGLIHLVEELKTLIEEIVNGNLDVSKYATKKEETDAKITEIDVVTEDEIKALFTTEGLATTSYVDNAVSNIPATDLSNYYTKSEVDALVATNDNSTDTGGEDNGTDNGGTEGGEETPTPTVTGTAKISGNTSLKVGFTRTYAGKFYDADGVEVTDTDVVGTFTISDCNFTSEITTDTTTANKIKLTVSNEDLIGETLTLTFSDPNGNYTSSSVTITVVSAF